MGYTGISRRSWLQVMAAGTAASPTAMEALGRQEAKPGSPKASVEPLPDHERRMQWWRDAKFGMFIHWGLYSQWARGEWVLAMEGSRLILSPLPAQPPDKPVTVIALEFDTAPVQNSTANRIVYAVLGGGPES